MSTQATLLFLVTEDWYFCSHRLVLARAAKAHGYRVVVATRVARDRERIEAEGFTVRSLRLRRRGLHPWRELLCILDIVMLYRRELPQVVHHVALKPVVYGSLAARCAGVSGVVNAIAGFGFVFTSTSLRARVLRPFVSAAYRLAFSGRNTRVIVQNEDDAEAVRRLGVSSERIVLVPGSGVDLEHFRPLPEPPIPVVVTMVSRMLKDKGVLEMVDAARQLCVSHPDVRIRLVGPPDIENPTSMRVHELEARVCEGVLEWCPGTDNVSSVWAASHVAVLPSYREGLPKSLLEAAACGRPLIATDVPGCRDVVIDDVTGVLVPPRDSDALACAIARLVGDPALRRRMGDAARAHVARFAEPLVVAATLAIYDELRRQSGPP